ncbi:MAG TPA: helix-turn-helix transcriptional regulator [Burkholderiaceae bacterium]|nr:helix-turn-helix transcriptional regulator [Burkholderiaceae bacterium]
MPNTRVTSIATTTAAVAPTPIQLNMPSPSGEQLKAARLAAGLNQAQAAELMGFSLQTGSRGGLQSRTWQALESPTDERNMQGPVFAMFLLLTGQHPDYTLAPRQAAPVDPAGATPGN